MDSDHPLVAQFCRDHVSLVGSVRQRAVSLYFAVRDGFRYSPWDVSTRPEGFKASEVLARGVGGAGHCIDKAVVMTACARHLGIPARLHFADVRNHIATEQLERKLGTDLLVFHGYVELWLGERWVAATPAFNRELCQRLGVAALDFDGLHDSIFQAYDRDAGRFMEYVTDRGSHADLPWTEMVQAWRQHYRGFASSGQWPRPDGVTVES